MSRVWVGTAAGGVAPWPPPHETRPSLFVQRAAEEKLTVRNGTLMMCGDVLENEELSVPFRCVFSRYVEAPASFGVSLINLIRRWSTGVAEWVGFVRKPTPEMSWLQATSWPRSETDAVTGRSVFTAGLPPDFNIYQMFPFSLQLGLSTDGCADGPRIHSKPGNMFGATVVSHSLAGRHVVISCVPRLMSAGCCSVAPCSTRYEVSRRTCIVRAAAPLSLSQNVTAPSLSMHL